MNDAPTGEPLFHSHWTDVLPDSDPRAFTCIDCSKCGCMVHCGNNECMTTWVEWGKYVVCGDCLLEVLKIMDGVMNWREFEDFCTGVGKSVEERK